jgi:hypothetical protein
VWAGERGADFRALTQDETDALIRAELVLSATAAQRDEVVRAVGKPCAVDLGNAHRDGGGGLQAHGILFAHCQRGGIDSDPLVRVLARRAWGDRDRQWFELRAVRARDAARVLHTRYVWRLGR